MYQLPIKLTSEITHFCKISHMTTTVRMLEDENFKNLALLMRNILSQSLRLVARNKYRLKILGLNPGRVVIADQ